MPDTPARKLPAPEALLALIAGRDRAAALYGDLLELAQSRTRLWFAAAYLRTLLSLTWRIVLALFLADIGREFIFNLFHLYLRHTPAVWRSATGSWLDLLNHAGPLLACIMSTLWFALPFAAVVYGPRDRFVRLTLALCLGTTAAFLAIPFASLLLALATLALAAAALFSSAWRKPLEVLLCTGAAGIVTIAASTVLARQFLFHHPAISHSLGSHPSAGNLFAFAFQSSLLLVAFVCSRMHTLLLDRPSPQDRTLA